VACPSRTVVGPLLEYILNGGINVSLCRYPPVWLYAARSLSTAISRLTDFGTLIIRHLEDGGHPVLSPVTSFFEGQKVVKTRRPHSYQGSLDAHGDLQCETPLRGRFYSPKQAARRNSRGLPEVLADTW